MPYQPGPLTDSQRRKKQKKLLYKRMSASKAEQYQVVAKMAYSLNKRLPRSEVWFNELYKDFKDSEDKSNLPFMGKYIPDLINNKFQYVIEVDGSFHDSIRQQKKDKIKDEFYMVNGYLCLRIKAYDEDSFKQAMIQLCRYRTRQSFKLMKHRY